MATNKRVTWINLTPEIRLRQDAYCYSVERLRHMKDKGTGEKGLVWTAEGKFFPNLEQSLKHVVTRMELNESSGEQIDLMAMRS